MSAAVHMQQQQASIMRGPGGSKPYSLFMMSPERVLGLKRAAEVSEKCQSNRTPDPSSPWGTNVTIRNLLFLFFAHNHLLALRLLIEPGGATTLTSILSLPVPIHFHQ